VASYPSDPKTAKREDARRGGNPQVGLVRVRKGGWLTQSFVDLDLLRGQDSKVLEKISNMSPCRKKERRPSHGNL